MASFVQRATYDSYSTGSWLHWVCRVKAIRESGVTFNKSLCNLCLRFDYHTDVSQDRQSKLMTKIIVKKMQMITIKGRLCTDMGERSMLFGFELTFKCHSMYLSLLITE